MASAGSGSPRSRRRRRGARARTGERAARLRLEPPDLPRGAQFSELPKDLAAATLDGVVQILVQEPDDQEAGSLIREYLSPDGNLDRLRETCAA